MGAFKLQTEARPLLHEGSFWVGVLALEGLWPPSQSPSYTYTHTDNAPLSGTELIARGRREDSKQGVVVLRKGKYLLNKTKQVSVPFFRLC